MLPADDCTLVQTLARRFSQITGRRSLDLPLRQSHATEPGQSIGIDDFKLSATFRPLRQTRTVPTATKSLDQQDGIRHPTSQNIHRSNLIRESRILSCDYLKIARHASLVAFDGKL